MRDGDEWVINGQKIWATGAGAKNNVINVYVKTDPKAHYRQGMSLFLVDNTTPGLELRKLDMLGRRCTGTYEVFFNDVRVPPTGWSAARTRAGSACCPACRSSACSPPPCDCGARAARSISPSTMPRSASSSAAPIGSIQAIAHMLADMQTEVEAARGLMWRAAWLVPQGQDALREITMAKLFASETYVKVANVGMQMFGGYGYNMEFDMQRHFRDSRAATIAAGTIAKCSATCYGRPSWASRCSKY